MEKLPLETIEVLCTFLTTRDLVACCAATRNMRDLFGSDCVWRSRCDKDLEGYLSATPCKVQPEFVSPEQGLEHNTLTPISHWRMAFMRQNHLWNNWRQGKQVSEEIRIGDPKYEVMFHSFFNNDCVVVFWKNKMQILDVKGSTTKEATEPVQFAGKITYDYHCIVENDMVILKFKSGIQVYHIDLLAKQCSLEHFFFFEDSQKLPFNGPNDILKALDSNKSLSVVTLHIVVGTFFVGVLHEGSTMNIWNLKNGLKLKEEALPIKQRPIKTIKSDRMNLILCVQEQEVYSNTFLVYNLNTLSFQTFSKTFHGACQYTVLKDLVAICANECLHVFNYHTSELLLTNISAESRGVENLGDNVVFVQEGVLKMLIPSCKIVKSLTEDRVLFCDVLGTKFMKIFRNGSLEIWEFSKFDKSLKQTRMCLPLETSRYQLNKASTRYIVEKNVGIVRHFW